MNYKFPAAIIAEDISSTFNSMLLRTNQSASPVRSRLDHCPTAISRYNMSLITRHDEFSQFAVQSLQHQDWGPSTIINPKANRRLPDLRSLIAHVSQAEVNNRYPQHAHQLPHAIRD